MRDPKQSLDLSPLHDDFDIVGELGSGEETRTFTATRKGAASNRKDDQTGVLIEVVTAPAADEANALSHLAADTQLLMRLRHRRLIPVLEGRWLGQEAFAVITQRINDPSLAQILEQGEVFSNPRTAAILREVNGLLEWAREQKVVHRTITADRIYLEPKTDRVRVSFAVAAIARLQTSDRADVDARTIARLAVEMLTGSADPRTEDESLGEQRPDLPAQLIEATAALLGGATETDVAAYIALVGMAEPLAAGETEAERIRDEILAEQQSEREKLVAERAEFERMMEKERQALSAERETLALKISEERAALVATRAELERAAAARRAELEGAAEQDRQRLAELRAAIERAGELEIEKKRQTALDDISDAESAGDEDELATPALVLPVSAPLQPLTFESLTLDDDGSPETTSDESDESDDVDESDEVDESGERAPTTRRRKWIVPGAIGATLIAVVAVLVMATRSTPPPTVAKPAASAVAPTAPTTVLPTPAVPLPATPSVDSSVIAPARSPDSMRAVAPVVKRKPKVVVLDSTVRRDSTSVGDILSRVPGASPTRPDSFVRRDRVTRPDTAAVPPTNPPA